MNVLFQNIKCFPGKKKSTQYFFFNFINIQICIMWGEYVGYIIIMNGLLLCISFVKCPAIHAHISKPIDELVSHMTHMI